MSCFRPDSAGSIPATRSSKKVHIYSLKCRCELFYLYIFLIVSFIFCINLVSIVISEPSTIVFPSLLNIELISPVEVATPITALIIRIIIVIMSNIFITLFFSFFLLSIKITLLHIQYKVNFYISHHSQVHIQVQIYFLFQILYNPLLFFFVFLPFYLAIHIFLKI